MLYHFERVYGDRAALMRMRTSGEQVTRSFGPIRAMGPHGIVSKRIAFVSCDLSFGIRQLTVCVCDPIVREMRAIAQDCTSMPELTPAGAKWSIKGCKPFVCTVLGDAVKHKGGGNDEPAYGVNMRKS